MLHQADGAWSVRTIPRSREVGQSYMTSVWTTLLACFAALMLVWQEAPELVGQNCPTPLSHSATFKSTASMPSMVTMKLHAGVGEWTWYLHSCVRCLLVLEVRHDVSACATACRPSDMYGTTFLQVYRPQVNHCVCGEHCQGQQAVYVRHCVVQDRPCGCCLRAMARAAGQVPWQSIRRPHHVVMTSLLWASRYTQGA